MTEQHSAKAAGRTSKAKAPLKPLPQSGFKRGQRSEAEPVGAGKLRSRTGRRTPVRSATPPSSPEVTREINRDLILELIRLRQPTARVDLARASGLQNSTVSSIVEQLQSEGWICEGEAVKTARGRPPTHITLNGSLALLVADIHPGRATLAVVDLNGQILTRSTLQLRPDVRAAVDQLGQALLKLKERHPEKTFEGAGLCVPGRVDEKTGLLVMAPNLPWQTFDIQRELAKRLGLEVELENDANACLLSELWFGHLDGVTDAVLLAISEGVGASLLAGGRLVSGRLGMAGEFGHVCYEPGGPPCGCGRRGCWEVFASSRATLGYYRELHPETAAESYGELCALAFAGNPAARTALERQAVVVGRGLRMINAALAPSTILFAGEFAASWPISQPIVERECQAGLLAGTPPRLVCTGDGERAHLLGAAAVVLRRHTGFYRARSLERAASAYVGAH